MKLLNFAAGIAVLAGAFFLSSCSEDFKVAAPYKDVTVVYGLLNAGDSVQYIRIQKTFMDENRSAIDLAKISDSSYYPEQDLEVRLKGISGSSVTSDEVLKRVNMANEGLPKQQGIFFSDPSYAYKYAKRLNPSLNYRLVIRNIKTGNVDSAQTNVITTDSSQGSGNFYIPFFFNFAQKLSFQNVPIDNTFKLSVFIPTNARYFEGYIRFKYASSTNGGPQTDSSFIWNFASGAPLNTTDAQITLATNRSGFYSTLRDNIHIAPANVVRYLDSADMFVWAANEPFYTYMQVNDAQGGITADQIKPNFTNVQGKDVLGIFASRAMRIRYNVPIDRVTLDSIRRNLQTAPLNFAPTFADH